MKRHIDWLLAVFGIFGTAYGGYLVLWHYGHGNGIHFLGMLLLVLGGISLLLFLLLMVPRALGRWRRGKKAVTEESAAEEAEEAPTESVEEKAPEVEEGAAEEEAEETPLEEMPQPGGEDWDCVSDGSGSSYQDSYAPTVYVRLLGHGPILRIEGARILDMRDGTYYRIEGDTVYQEGYGPRFEIRGSSIKDAYGGGLYELSGSFINKVYGGAYASMDGNWITLLDGSRKYEISDSLSRKLVLALAALLFER